MYLSELFLAELGDDFTEENVEQALQKCQECFDAKTKDIGGPAHVIKFIMANPGVDEIRRAYLYKEVIDFWDVFAEFEEEKEWNFEITKVAMVIGEKHRIEFNRKNF